MNGLKKHFPGLLLLMLCISITSNAHANPANRRAFARYFGSYLTEDLNSCSTCHVRAHADGAESLDEFPHNAFGNQLRIEEEILHKAKRDTSIELRLKVLAEKDTDGDGFSNLQEILMGTAPGDKTKFPGAGSADKMQKLTSKFTEFQNRYSWKRFKPIKRPEVPIVEVDHWTRNPIDHFIAAGHKRKGLKHAAEATPALSLRRV